MAEAGVVAWVVALAHLALVAFMALAPFSSSPSLLVMHVLLTPVLWVHWLVGDDSCVLTLLEHQLRGVDNTDSFMHRLVGPVYNISDPDARMVSWLGSVLLWAVSASRVTRQDFRTALGV